MKSQDANIDICLKCFKVIQHLNDIIRFFNNVADIENELLAFFPYLKHSFFEEYSH